MKSFAFNMGVVVAIVAASFVGIAGIDWVVNRTRTKRDPVQRDVDDVFRQDKAREARRRDDGGLNKMWDEEEGL